MGSSTTPDTSPVVLDLSRGGFKVRDTVETRWFPLDRTRDRNSSSVALPFCLLTLVVPCPFRRRSLGPRGPGRHTVRGVRTKEIRTTHLRY